MDSFTNVQDTYYYATKRVTVCKLNTQLNKRRAIQQIILLQFIHINI